MIRHINLTKGHLAVIDEEDYEKVINFGSWQALVLPKHIYAKITKRYGSRSLGKSRTILLHNFILDRFDLSDNMRVDHLNYQTLDCRKENLRIVTVSFNGANREGLQSNNISEYNGVYWNNQKQKWHAEIWKDQKKIHVGFFASKEEANLARLKRQGELWPEFLFS